MAANQPQNPPLIATAPAVAPQLWNPPQMTSTLEEIVEANRGRFIPIIEGIIDACGGQGQGCFSETVLAMLPGLTGITLTQVNDEIRRWRLLKIVKKKTKILERNREFLKSREEAAAAAAHALAQLQVAEAPTL